MSEHLVLEESAEKPMAQTMVPRGRVVRGHPLDKVNSGSVAKETISRGPKPQEPAPAAAVESHKSLPAQKAIKKEMVVNNFYGLNGRPGKRLHYT
ncbi:hypothetical protein NC651_026055 [Populus alba x Populus x berolinensis]|nr:hypothetical protein NC651_026055 [Populus alba x Populus x berolinensis]